jgi:hypothetical protein
VVDLKGRDKEIYGALYIEADTETNVDTRMVLLKNFRVTQFNFPNLDKGLAKKARAAINNALPKNKSLLISLDRVLAGLEQTKQKRKGIDVNLDPPPIYYSQTPAILVNFMGEPKFEPVKGVSKLLYAVNTNWDILLEVGTSKYFLLYGENWLVTSDVLKGRWKAVGALPKSFGKLPNSENWKAVKKSIPGKKVTRIPRVVIATKPSELIVTTGKPQYSPISGTKLLYATNTESEVFLDSKDGQLYFLTAGRWFRAKSLNGPWSSASRNLPDDFQKIPATHAKAHVLSSVPGTSDAEAAVLLASVPRKAKVKRKDTTVVVVYEGDPKFVEIEDTSAQVFYAVNTPNQVFRVAGKYYCVYNGVWFVSNDAKGPWVVATQVPAAIYSIPSSHPTHNVTYVYVYDSTPDTVVVGYTSGYSGNYVAATGVLMFGLGYWAGHDHYDHYHYYYPSHYYAYGGAARYDYYHGGYYRGASYYGPYGGVAGRAGYNPATGTYYRGGVAAGPYGSAYARQAYNPYTNRYGARAGASTPYGSWGRSVVADGDNWARAGHRSYGGKTVGAIETSRGTGAVAGYNRQTGQGAVVRKNQYGDVYAGHDGNVYKRNGSSWESVNRSQSSGSYSRSNLNREYQARQTGATRASTYQRSASSYRSSGSYRGGGGFRGRR